jgi:dipeptidyl aminopeptidase/acylaminoacyl peptidase
MDQLADALERLNRVRFAGSITFHRSGDALATAISPASHDANESYQGRIWHYTLDGKATQLTHGPNEDSLPAYSPIDDRLAFASDRTVKGKADLFILADGKVHALGNIPGTIEDLRWSGDARSIFVLAADRGLDGGATNGAIRIWWGGTEDPAVTNATDAKRRLFRVTVADGATVEIGPKDYTVWEFDLIGDGAVALVSEDASERGWYHTKLARLDFSKRSVEILHRSSWQLQSVSASPSGTMVAFLEGWSSDRGLVAGAMRVLDLASGKVFSVAEKEQSSITSLQWRDDERLWFAGWSRLGTIYGVVKLDGIFEWTVTEDAVIGANSFNAAIVPKSDGSGIAAIRDAVAAPPEIIFKKIAPGSNADWQKISALNGDVFQGFDYPEVRHAQWKGRDGLALEALILLPKDRKGPLPTIVDIHGGPSWATRYASNPGHGLPYAAAGYAVFLPNYRGNTGWGQAFGRMNIGDPGGAEFEDILTGIDWCVAQGLTDGDKLGVTGGSYGGYMTAWAVATTRRFKAAVMVSGICNQVSCHYSCNHDFHEFINGGPMKQNQYRAVAVDRSPLYRLDKPTTPTLIIHGIEDRCTPLGQGQEFYSALLERGCESELVAYPREGHGNREYPHKVDAWRRSVAWFDRFLRPERVTAE